MSVPLGNPLSEEAGVLRPSLVPGMLTMIAGNLHRDVSDVRLFELGTVFSGTTEKVEERPAVAFGAVGSLPEQGALHPGRAIDFHDVKGAVEQVLARFQARSVYFDRFPAEAGLTPEWLHPYRSARVAVEGATVGWFGQLHPSEAARRKLKEPVLVGELYLDRLYKLPLRKPAAREISRFQPVRRDFSLVLDESIGWEKIDRALAGLQIPELVEWRVREVFRDDAKLGAGEYSLAAGRDLPGCRTARCARKSCRASRRRWWRLLARRGRDCGVRQKNRLNRRYTCSDKMHLSGGFQDAGVFLEL